MIKDLIKSYGKEVYIVGGYLRNKFMNTSYNSIDIDLVCENAEDFITWMKKNSTATSFSIYKRSGCVSFKLGRIQYECSSLIGDSLLEDSSHRDFCCNCIYQSLLTDKIIDPTGRGISDAKSKIIKTPVNPEITFRNDPLRMLRAFRFSCKYDMNIDFETFEGIKSYPEYYCISLERIRDEFSEILKTSKASKIIRFLHEKNLLSYIFPYLEEAWGFNQNSKYHSMNLTDHILAVLDYIPSYYDDVRWAALLHDISKYKEYQIKPDGEFSFHSHEISSSKMAEYLLERLKMPKENIKRISGLIKYHMYLKQYYNKETDSYTGSYKTTRRFIRKVNEEKIKLDDLLLLIDADNHSHFPKYNMPGQIRSFKEKLESLKLKKEISNKPKNRISGDLIMSELGLSPGKQIKDIKEIMETYLDENPSMDFKSIIQKYKEEFNGKTFEIVNQGNSCIINGETIYNISCSLPNGIYKAIQYPGEYNLLIEQKEITNIIGEAIRVLGKLDQYPNFKSLQLSIDEFKDFSAVIERESGNHIYIV